MSGWMNLSWLCIGLGIGMTLGRHNLAILIIGISILSFGFLIHLLEESERRQKHK